MYMEDLLELNGRFLNYNNTFYNQNTGSPAKVNKVVKNVDNVKDYKLAQIEACKK